MIDRALCGAERGGERGKYTYRYTTQDLINNTNNETIMMIWCDVARHTLSFGFHHILCYVVHFFVGDWRKKILFFNLIFVCHRDRIMTIYSNRPFNNFQSVFYQPLADIMMIIVIIYMVYFKYFSLPFILYDPFLSPEGGTNRHYEDHLKILCQRF